MPPDVNVTFEQMQNAAQQLSAGQEEIISQLSRMKAMIDELIQSGFVTDVASKAFGEAYEEFNTGVTQTIQGLDIMSGYLKSTAEKFEEADRTSTIQINRS